MSGLSALSALAVQAFGALGEFVLLRTAERTVRAYAPEQESTVRAHAAAARRRLAAGRRTWDAIAASALLLDAVRHLLIASKVAADAAVDEASLTAKDLADAMPPLPPEPSASRLTVAASDDERVRAAVASSDALYLDRLDPAEGARTRIALERAASMLRRRVEARSAVNIRGTRWGRVAGLALLVVYLGVTAARAVFLPKNVALGKPVHPSSSRHGDGKELVDGELATVPGVFTNVEEAPSAVIDLMDVYALDEVRVHNRLDQAFDDCLPLAVEVSTDGSSYREIGRRDAHFAADPPWVVAGNHVPARYVRVKVLHRGYLALSEVEVFGKKAPPHPTTGK
jgi:hypothetical protein